MKWLRIVLEAIGASSILALVVVSAWFFYSKTSDKVDAAKRNDVLFIFNSSGIASNQDFRILSSYQSRRSMTGDHLDFYCIEISKFDVADWAKELWRDGPEMEPLLAEALESAVNDARQHSPCFLPLQEANSEGIKVAFESVVLYGRHPTAADIILYAPRKKMLYYVSYKT